MKPISAKLSEVAPAIPLKVINVPDDKRVWQLTLDHIQSNTGQLLKKNIEPHSQAGSSTHWFDEKYVLYSKLRPYLNKVILPDTTGIGTTELVTMLPKPERLDRKYLAYYLMSKGFVDWVSSQTSGAKMPRVSMKIFWDHQIPLPPIEEQKRIAAILDKADAIRRKRQQAIDLADQFLRSVFLDMFGDPVTNPKGWETVALGNHLDFIRYGTGSPPEYIDRGIPFVRATNVKNGTISEKGMAYISEEEAIKIKKCKLREGNLIIVRSGVNAGDCAYISEKYDGAYGGYDLILGLEKNKALFFNELLNSNYGKWLIDPLKRRAGQPHVNSDQIKSLVLISPSEAEIERFRLVKEKVEGQKEQFRQNMNQIDSLFGSLNKDAFKGELTKGKAA